LCSFGEDASNKGFGKTNIARIETAIIAIAKRRLAVWCPIGLTTIKSRLRVVASTGREAVSIDALLASDLTIRAFAFDHVSNLAFEDGYIVTTAKNASH